MAVTATPEEVGQALQQMETMLRADGYELKTRVAGERLLVWVQATGGACEECLVPKQTMGLIAASMLANSGIEVAQADIVLTYPGESPAWAREA
jgi:Fe-S cluster biogenesis protein NfuA